MNCVCISPDNKLIASGAGDYVIKVWNNTTMNINQEEGHSALIHDLCISQDGKLVLTASEDKSIKVWDRSNGQFMHSLEGHLDAVNAVCISPD